MKSPDDVLLIAPCGMNCGICMAYLRTKVSCPGCRGDDSQKQVSCLHCRIKSCPVITGGAEFCFECENIPCARLKQLDKRYRTKYHMSMLENLGIIKEEGMEKFLEREKDRWTCPVCGGTVNVHRGTCHSCGKNIFE